MLEHEREPVIKRTASVPHTQSPDRRAALACYGMRATVYDSELAPFEPLRHEAIGKLQLQGGETVLDVGCGTGLSFAPLKAALGEAGVIVGIEQCPQMLGKARERIEAMGWSGITLVNAAVHEAPLIGLADAAMFHFTHDILRQPEAIANIARHLKPGARVVATGLQWAAPWAWPVNLFVWGAALYSVTTMDGMERPWTVLAAQIPDLDVSATWMGGIFMATGTWQGPAAASGRRVSAGR